MPYLRLSGKRNRFFNHKRKRNSWFLCNLPGISAFVTGQDCEHLNLCVHTCTMNHAGVRKQNGSAEKGIFAILLFEYTRLLF